MKLVQNVPIDGHTLETISLLSGEIGAVSNGQSAFLLLLQRLCDESVQISAEDFRKLCEAFQNEL